MSSYYTPSLYTPRRQELQWIGSIIQSHDCFCGCDNPVGHLATIALRKEGIYGFNKESLKQLCQEFTEETSGDQQDGDNNAGAAEDIVDFGILEKLFEEDGPLTENDSG